MNVGDMVVWQRRSKSARHRGTPLQAQIVGFTPAGYAVLRYFRYYGLVTEAVSLRHLEPVAR